MDREMRSRLYLLEGETPDVRLAHFLESLAEAQVARRHMPHIRKEPRAKFDRVQGGPAAG